MEKARERAETAASQNVSRHEDHSSRIDGLADDTDSQMKDLLDVIEDKLSAFTAKTEEHVRDEARQMHPSIPDLTPLL